MKRLIYFFCVIMLVGGCGSSGSYLTGNVKFDDGSPLTTGTVMLSKDAKSYIGQIDESGNFAIGTLEKKLKIPAGTYSLNVSSAPGLGEKDKVETSSANPSNIEIVSGKTAKLEITVKKAAE
jgi:hypothetical protein